MKLSQNQLNTSEYSDDPPPYENTTASPQSSHKLTIGSLKSQSSANLDPLLQDRLNTKGIEVSQYYLSPSSTYHTYASLQRPSGNVHQSQENIPSFLQCALPQVCTNHNIKVR